MKLATQILDELFSQDESAITDALRNKLHELGFEGVDVSEVATEFGGDTLVTFVDEEGSESDILFTYDEEEGPVAIYLDETHDNDDPDDDNDIDFVELGALEPNIIEMGNGDKAIDLVNLSWLNTSALDAILTQGDIHSEEESSMSERKIAVIRGGKKVKLALVRKKRKKRLTGKQRAAVAKGVRKRSAKKSQINRKRKKSLKIRKRLALKNPNKNKRMKVAGTANRKI